MQKKKRGRSRQKERRSRRARKAGRPSNKQHLHLHDSEDWPTRRQEETKEVQLEFSNRRQKGKSSGVLKSRGARALTFTPGHAIYIEPQTICMFCSSSRLFSKVTRVNTRYVWSIQRRPNLTTKSCWPKPISRLLSQRLA